MHSVKKFGLFCVYLSLLQPVILKIDSDIKANNKNSEAAALDMRDTILSFNNSIILKLSLICLNQMRIYIYCCNLSTACLCHSDKLTMCYFNACPTSQSLVEPALTLTTLIYFCLNHGEQRFFKNHHKCLSYLFLLHLNTFVMGLLPLLIFHTFRAGGLL